MMKWVFCILTSLIFCTIVTASDSDSSQSSADDLRSPLHHDSEDEADPVIAEIQERIDELSGDINSIKDRFTDLEERIDDLEEVKPQISSRGPASSSSSETRLTTLERSVETALAKISDLEKTTAYTAGGFTDYRANVRYDAPLMIGLALSGLYYTYMAISTGDVFQLMSSIPVFYWSYTTLSIFTTKVLSRLNVPMGNMPPPQRKLLKQLQDKAPK